jgi:DNA-binding transcriptional MerR regulator
MKIGEAARQLGLNPRTLRYYEGIGLLPAHSRTPGGFRVFTEGDVDRVRFIRDAQRLGFTLGEVREVLGFRDQGLAPCDYVRELIKRRRDEMEEHIRALQEMKAVFDRLAERAASLPRGGPEEQQGVCHIIESGFSAAATGPAMQPEPATRK